MAKKQRIEATCTYEPLGYRKGDVLVITDCLVGGVRAKNLTRSNHYGRDNALLSYGDFRYLDEDVAVPTTKSERKFRGFGRMITPIPLAMFSAVIALVIGASSPEAFICALLTLIYTEIYGGGAK